MIMNQQIQNMIDEQPTRPIMTMSRMKLDELEIRLETLLEFEEFEFLRDEIKETLKLIEYRQSQYDEERKNG